MKIKTILLIALVLILLYVAFTYIFSSSSTLSTLQDAKTSLTIPGNSLASGSNGQGSTNYTYSIWFYIDDWNYRYGETKVVFGRMTPSSTTRGPIPNVNGLEPCPLVTLNAIQNNLDIYVTTYPGSDIAPAEESSSSTVEKYSITNIPIQKWVNLLISVYGRTLDVYLDGKLVNTFILSGVAKINPGANVEITPAGPVSSAGSPNVGFSGFTSQFQYWPTSTDPQTAWNIYQAGYGNSWLSSIFGRYKIKLALMDGTNENSSVSI